MKKILLGAAAAIVTAGIVIGYASKDRIDRAQTVASLFSGAEQYENFPRMHEMFPHATMPPADQPFQFSEGERITLPASYVYEGSTNSTEEFLADTDTSALLVVKDGAVVFEDYWLTGGRDVTWLSMSVAKSFVSALVGIAVEEGHISSIMEPVTAYVPGLAGSAYDGVAIKDILQMSSGASWNEDYSDPNSDINRFGRIFALGGSMDEFAATLTRENEPGTFNRYNSTDTQVLGMLLVATTGRSITDYMTEKLWQPMGAESPAHWLLDAEGMEMAFAGLNATARDYAKIGELYRLGGRLNGQQILSDDWVTASVTPDAPHLMPGKDNPATDYEVGYAYQWWVPEGEQGEFSAIGVYNQFVFVNPSAGVVIVKLSANSAYGTSDDESTSRELETFEMFRAIVESVAE
ncbi:MAG: serine hydrolase domain-containing protein [Pseudomonadota bacterium]